MKFICLVYAEPDALSRLTAREKAALDRDSLAYDQELGAAERDDCAQRARTPR